MSLRYKFSKVGLPVNLRTGPLTTDLEGGPALWFPKTVAMVCRVARKNTIGQLRSAIYGTRPC
jgi:hypothetical protein